jgi:hypothetical protein
LLVGSLEVGAGLLRRPKDDLSVVLPVPTAIPAPTEATSPGASPAGSAVPVPSAVAVLGETWAPATVPVVLDRPVGRIEAVTAGGPGFVAVGRGCIGNTPSCEAIVWTSADGRSWVRAPGSDATNIGSAFPMSGPEIGMFDVAAGSPGIVAIGYAARPDMQATVWFSPDGTSWERLPLGGVASTRVHAVAWDGREFVVVGEDRTNPPRTAQEIVKARAKAAVWTSADGRTWSRVPHTADLDVGGFIDTMEDPGSGGMADVVAGPGGLVAVGSTCSSTPVGAQAHCEPAAWTSANGSAWTRSAGMPALAGVLNAVAASGSGYVAVGAQTCDPGTSAPVGCPALVLTSPDGRTWSQQPFAQPGSLETVSAIGGRFVATTHDGPRTVWVSGDGTSWAPASAQGGPPTETGGADWHLAATPSVAVWLGKQTESDDPAAWVSPTLRP